MKSIIVALALAGVAAAVCVQRRVDVDDGPSLTAALNNAQPGDIINLATGQYNGRFAARASGQPDCSITVRGSFYGVTLDGGDTSSTEPGFAVYGSYWYIGGFTVKNAGRGLVIDGGQHNTIDSVLATNVGAEGFVIQNKANDNTIKSFAVSNTGIVTSSLGYGVLVGSSDTDACTDNTIKAGTVGYYCPMEGIVVRAASARTFIRDNTFSAVGMSGGQSWAALYSDSNTITLCSGSNPTSSQSLVDGFRIHGSSNVISRCSGDVRGSGYGYNVISGTSNRVCVSNTASNALMGITNVNLDGSC